MTTTMDRWPEVKPHLDAALDIALEDRLAYLDRHCAGDSGLRAEIESYLADESQVTDFIEKPAADLVAGRRLRRRTGDRLGAFRLEDRIGQGGMGEVYLAHRVDVYDQRTAVKILKRGLDTEEIVRRFDQERRILARLEHPRIARILDGGSTEDGLPYFVMDYVEGTPVDRFCEERGLEHGDVLELFCKICETVQIAHQNLVVHCDLKPANILVTDDGEPKLLDFGIAKILRADDDPDAPRTAVPWRLGTPRYACPELGREGEPVTTASDVYSLGALLYKLATGLPAPDDPCGHKPPGDLGYIVCKATDRDPARRYATAEALAEDVCRYLTHQPVMARQGRLPYHVGRFVRRNLRDVVIGAFMLLFMFVTGLLFLLQRTEHQRDRAFLMRDTILTFVESLDLSNGAMSSEVANEILDNALRMELSPDPLDRAMILDRLGRAYYRFDFLAEARQLLEESLELRNTTEGIDPSLVAASLNNLALVLIELGESEKGIAMLREALALSGAKDVTARIDMLTNLATGLEDQGKYSEAEVIYREILEEKRSVYDATSEEVAIGLNNLGSALFKQDKLDEAEPLLVQTLEIRREHLPPDNPLVATTLINLAVLFDAKGDYRTAIELHEEALAIRRRLYTADDPALARNHSALAYALLGSGAPDELAQAETLLRRAIESHRQALGEAHPNTLIFERNLAAVLLARGRPEEAETLTFDVLLRAFESWPPGHWRIADVRSVLGHCLVEQGRYEEAERLVVESYPVIRDARGEGSRPAREARERVVSLYRAWGRPEEAERLRTLPGARPVEGTRGGD